MPLDPQVQVMLDQLRTLNIPSQAELGVAGARELSDLAARMGPDPVPVADVQDLLDHEYIRKCKQNARPAPSLEEVRNALSAFKGSFSDTISEERDEP